MNHSTSNLCYHCARSVTCMNTPHFPARLIFFDCDSTLTTIEGIDELARLKGQFDHIAELTRRAMDGEIKLEEVFAARLELLRPTRADLRRIAEAYRESIVPDARETIDALRFAGCSVYIISGGLLPAVQDFARSIGVNRSHVHAVPIEFDQLSGQWWRYHRHRYSGNPDEQYLDFMSTPLTETQGKRSIIEGISDQEKRTMLIGDGITDLEARDAVKYFIGFGGVARRDRVASEADIYIQARGLASIVPLALTEEQTQKLMGTEHEDVLQRGLNDIQTGLVRFNDKT